MLIYSKTGYMKVQVLSILKESYNAYSKLFTIRIQYSVVKHIFKILYIMCKNL